jgi:hypothetical protein
VKFCVSTIWPVLTTWSNMQECDTTSSAKEATGSPDVRWVTSRQRRFFLP